MSAMVGIIGKRNGVIKDLGNLDDATYEATQEFYSFGKLNAEGYDFNNTFAANDQPMFAYIRAENNNVIYYVINDFIRMENGKIKVIGSDLKSLLDFDFIFDFTKADRYTKEVMNLISDISIRINVNNAYDFEFSGSYIEAAEFAHTTIASVINCANRYFIANAYNFIKTIMVLKNTYIVGELEIKTNNKIGIRWRAKTITQDNPNEPSHVDRHFKFYLPDFNYEKTNQRNAITQATATIAYDVEFYEASFVEITEAEYNAASGRKIQWYVQSLQNFIPTPEMFDDTLISPLVDGDVFMFESDFRLLKVPASEAGGMGHKREVIISGTYPVYVDGNGKRWINREPAASLFQSEWMTSQTIKQFVQNNHFRYLINPFFKVIEKSDTLYSGYYPVTRESLELTYKMVRGSFKCYKYSSEVITERPVMPEVTYYLGNDNQIYQNSIPSDKRIFPAKPKIFEADTLYKSQLNALAEIASSRYPFNYMIKQAGENPFDLTELRIGDSINGIPISEIKYKNGEVESVRLGFKKMLLTEIIKSQKEKEIFNKR